MIPCEVHALFNVFMFNRLIQFNSYMNDYFKEKVGKH